MKRLLLVGAIICFSANVSHGVEYWAKTFGGSFYDGASAIQQTTDGGYIVGGTASRFFGTNDNDYWILKLDSSGSVEWEKIYGGFYSDSLSSIQQTSDAGYIVAGYAISFCYGGWILKLDDMGSISWQKSFCEGRAYSIKQTDDDGDELKDDGYIISGDTNAHGAVYNDFWIIKLATNGEVSWQKRYGNGNGNDHIYSVHQINDGTYVVVGSTQPDISKIYEDFWILNLDSNGNILSQKTYKEGDINIPYSIDKTRDGGYIVAGSAEYRGLGDKYIWVIKFDANNNISWQKTYGGSGETVFDSASSIQQTTDDGYILAGKTFVSTGNYNICIIKLDGNGNITWQKIYGDNRDWSAKSIQQTSDGDFIVAGITPSDYMDRLSDLLLMKLNNYGVVLNCSLMGTINTSAYDTIAVGKNTSAIVQDTSVNPSNTEISPLDTSAIISTVCSWAEPDADEDGIPDDSDNCPDIANGPDLGTCVNIATGKVGLTCTNDGECNTGESCSLDQEDRDHDGAGDACDSDVMCKGNFDFDKDVDGTDAFVFKTHFGRSTLLNPCPPDGPAPVEKTGQTTPQADYDDGYYQRGVALPSPRFKDNGNGTVTDNKTGIIWLKNANCFGQKSWDQALSDCSDLNSGECGLADGSSAGDWRLPNLNEMLSLIDWSRDWPPLPIDHPFENVMTDYYWTSTHSAYQGNDLSWRIWLVSGYINDVIKTDLYHVWPVRGGH